MYYGVADVQPPPGANRRGDRRAPLSADATGAGATEIGVLSYIDQALAGAYSGLVETYQLGLAALDRLAQARYGAPFASCTPEQQDVLLADMERDTLPEMRTPSPVAFFELLRSHTQGPASSPTRPMAAIATSSAGRCWATPACIWKTRPKRTYRRSRRPRAVSSNPWPT